MTMKSDLKFQETLACSLKNDMRNLAYFHQHLKVPILGLCSGSFCTKQKIYDLKTNGGVMCHDNEEYCKI